MFVLLFFQTCSWVKCLSKSMKKSHFDPSLFTKKDSKILLNKNRPIPCLPICRNI